MRSRSMSRSALKHWTDILTPWVQVIGLFAAGIFALVEYQDNKQDVKIQRSLTYLAKASSSELIEARTKLLERQHNQVGELREVLLQKGVTQDQINAAYFSFVVDGLIMHGTDNSLDTSFQSTLGFLEEGVVCSEEGLCDESVIKANLADFGRGFIRAYTPYLCYLRHVWNDPSIGRRAEIFYNPTAGKACEEYQHSAAVSRVTTLQETEKPKAEPQLAADGVRRR